MQAAAQSFERVFRCKEGAKGGGAIVASLRELPLKKISLVGEDRRLQLREPGERFVGFFLCLRGSADLQGDSG